MAQPKATDAKAPEERGGEDSVIVVDVRKKYRRKHIRNLRKGRGKLMGKVEDLLADLREEGALGERVRPVVVVVREKKGGGSRNIFGF